MYIKSHATQQIFLIPKPLNVTGKESYKATCIFIVSQSSLFIYLFITWGPFLTTTNLVSLTTKIQKCKIQNA